MIIRPIKPSDYPLLKDFLYYSIHQPDPDNPILRSVLEVPEVKNYIDDFGSRKGDYGLVAEMDDIIIGIAWVRILDGAIKGYGHVDGGTPELAISIIDQYRSSGVGTTLINDLLKLLKKENYKQCSLSVQKTNRAINLYIRLGFKIHGETNEDFIMIRKL